MLRLYSLLTVCLCLFGTSLLSASPKKKFDFKVLEKPLEMKVRATAYTHTEADHLIYGKRSAYGSYLLATKEYTSAAADWSFLPLGTVFRIKGYFEDTLFVIDDYGSALINKGTVDLYFETQAEMHQWGARRVEIEILRVGDYRASYMILHERAHWPHCYSMAKKIYDRYQKSKVAGN